MSRLGSTQTGLGLTWLTQVVYYVRRCATNSGNSVWPIITDKVGLQNNYDRRDALLLIYSSRHKTTVITRTILLWRPVIGLWRLVYTLVHIGANMYFVGYVSYFERRPSQTTTLWWPCITTNPCQHTQSFPLRTKLSNVCVEFYWLIDIVYVLIYPLLPGGNSM